MPTFDVVSKLDRAELKNAHDQAGKELAQRYDFRGTESRIEPTEDALTIFSNSDDRALASYSVLIEKLAKRNVSLKHFAPSKPLPGPSGGKKIIVTIKEGIDREQAKKLIAYLKGSKLKVQASVQEDTVRVSGKKRDDLQEAIAELKTQSFDVDLQFVNFRD